MILDIIDDALPHYAQESIKNILLHPTFPWYYRDITMEGLHPSKNKHHFIHSLLYNDMSKDHYFDNIMRFFSFPEFETHRLSRVQFNLNTPYKRRYIDNIKHEDLPGSGGVSYLYYPIDSDGPTTFYDGWRKRKVNPKQGRLVRFPSDTIHSTNVPFKYEKRIVLNIVFLPGTLK